MNWSNGPTLVVLEGTATGAAAGAGATAVAVANANLIPPPNPSVLNRKAKAVEAVPVKALDAAGDGVAGAVATVAVNQMVAPLPKNHDRAPFHRC